MTGTRRWQVKVIYSMNWEAVQDRTHSSYLYNLAVQTISPVCHILLLLVHPRHRYHGNHKWLYPCNKVLALQDSSQIHCLVLVGTGILLLKCLSSKTH